jgi:hypothetical protein
MPDVNTLTIAELWEHANYYVGAVRTDDPSNLTHNAQMLANLVERLSEQVSHFRPATSKIPRDDEPADNPDSVKSPGVYVKDDKRVRVSPEGQIGDNGGTFAQFPTVSEAVGYLEHQGYQAESPGFKEPATGSVKTWTYSRVNPGGADIAHGLTFTGTDDEWAEHLADLPYQGIEPYNAKITAPDPDGYADMARRALPAGLAEAERTAAADLAERITYDDQGES